MTAELPTASPILSADSIQRKLRRMAFQIAENNVTENHLIICGINGNGELVADALVEELRKILSATITQNVILINKTAPQGAIMQQPLNVSEKVVIVVDDVSASGRTLLYALSPFLQTDPKKIQTAVLVERSHKQFAVQPDYVGLSVATTLQDHIKVKAADGTLQGAWLH